MLKLTLTRGVSMTSARKSHINVSANVRTDVATSHSEIVDAKYTPRSEVCNETPKYDKNASNSNL